MGCIVFHSQVVSDNLDSTLIVLVLFHSQTRYTSLQDPDGTEWRRLVSKTADNSRRLRVAASRRRQTGGHQSRRDARTFWQRTG